MPSDSSISRGIPPLSTQLFAGFGGLTLVSIFLALATDSYFLAGLPALAIFAYVAIVDFRKLFFILLACLPLSTEVSLPGGFGTDLPSEPFMVSLMFIYLFYILYNVKHLNVAFLKHPISILLLLHLAWTFASSITAEIVYIAIKFSFARVWYVTVFYFLAGSLIKTVEDFRKAFWWVFIPLIITVAIVLVRYAGYGFAFEEVNSVLSPFYRNHITYASILVLFYPFVWFALYWYPKGSRTRYALIFSLLFLLVGIQFAYARMAYLSLFAAAGAYFIFQFRLGKLAIALSIILALFGVRTALHQNTFLEFAPDFEKTVTHYEFDNLVEATFKLEDISSMERVYRWVAAIYMVEEKPLMGVGPGNFYESYWGHTLNKFETYISDNIEKSGIHCYYLMILVEQGLVGLIIFLIFAFYPLVRGEQIYHETKDPLYKNLVMAMMLCLIVIYCLLFLNDLLESDKVGPFFLMAIAIIVNVDLRNQAEKEITAPESKIP